MAALLALQDVSRSFGSLRVIDGLSLAVADGEALGGIGPNGAGKTTPLNLMIRPPRPARGGVGRSGAGKTTALNLMMGRLRPERGAVVFDGRDVTRVAPHARCRTGIALTHQIPHPFEELTVFENVLVGGARGERWAYARWRAALNLSGLAPKANTRAGALTLLERKRLELARALATSPRVVLLDEIAGGLAEQEVHELGGVIPPVAREGGPTPLS